MEVFILNDRNHINRTAVIWLKHSLLPIHHKTPNIHSFQWEEQDLSGKHFKVILITLGSDFSQIIEAWNGAHFYRNQHFVLSRKKTLHSRKKLHNSFFITQRNSNYEICRKNYFISTDIVKETKRIFIIVCNKLARVIFLSSITSKIIMNIVKLCKRLIFLHC